MIPLAIRQFISICGGANLSRGAAVVEPLHDESVEPAFYIGQSDYVALWLHFKAADVIIACPFEPDTSAAALWAAGKLWERKCERAVVEAYARART